MARPITDIFPRPARVTLGGEVFLVGELRLGDIADIQDWLDRRHDPLAPVRPHLFAPEVPARDRHLFDEACDAADAGPVVWGDDRAWRALSTGEGLVTFLGVVLRRHQPYLTDGRILDVAERIEPGEYTALRQEVHRPDPVDLLGRAIDRLAGVESCQEPAPPYRWHEWVDAVSRSHGMTYEQIEGLTVGQLVNRLCQGKAPDGGGRPIAPGEDVELTARKRTAWLAGEDA